MMQRVREQGFSAVELLITFFIAAAFVGVGYQLYTIVVKEGSDSRLQSRASNVAYKNLRRYAAQVTAPCTTVSPSPIPTIGANDGLGNATIAVAITCPFGTGSTTSKVTVTIKYGAPQKEVVHALYASQQ